MASPSQTSKLRMLGLPIFDDLESFAQVTRLSKKFLYLHSSFSDQHYKKYFIPKKSGGQREISQPSKAHKAIQGWILRNILDLLQVSQASKGFAKKQTTADNAIPHIGANAILSLDLEDFFPSITANKVYSIFHSLGYSKPISIMLTSICTCGGKLPQGSPCSPKLANLVCIRLDNRVQGYVGARGVTYTRYADDLTFSAAHPGKLMHIFNFIRRIITEEGFSLNESKTRLAGTRLRKKVTGLVVTEGAVGVGRIKYRELRSKVFNLTKTQDIFYDQKEINEIYGWLGYLKSIDSKRYEKLVSQIETLKKNHKETSLDYLLV
ncbi:MAG: RNA-directed DNA polymerase [Nitrospina sp.]|jgi:RNA-directed DNA polymerase|nr:RNA-directed DNA polymerase [Nitrospina sp.]MBT3857928.1 RNA-directed DNA polymerase [Nitrospina sp.]MBT4103656.1 RNA-directed DNA polymerase [Nitrospina sp.]MBT4389836.1 RNA-directed DNA polymerase [Nitrospina sp.]MBT4621945.1 RNA-directed DNA polymerase [Nitrospina sp.]